MKIILFLDSCPPFPPIGKLAAVFCILHVFRSRGGAKEEKNDKGSFLMYLIYLQRALLKIIIRTPRRPGDIGVCVGVELSPSATGTGTGTGTGTAAVDVVTGTSSIVNSS